VKILIVGGGTAGFIAATILKKKFDITVDVVKSSDIGIVGVGEGSTEHFKDYLNFVGIDQYEFIKRTNSTFKCGIMFDGWSDKPYLHSVQTPYLEQFGQTYPMYQYAIANQFELNSDSLWENKINSWFVNKREDFAFNQFHFNTFMMNEFLQEISLDIGISIYEDTILEVVLDDTGSISHLIGEKNEYEYDFYIDSTGFKRLLIDKLGAKWVSYSNHLLMNSAIVFQTPNVYDDISMWTLARAMNSGWLFRLPTWDHYGNGYIFSNNHIDEEGVVKELEFLYGEKIEIGRKFSFDAGHVDRAWIKNCVALGLSSAFVEPLEATSIGTTIQQTFLLMHRIIGYTEKDIEFYNKSFTSIMDNIRDFIALHYITQRTDTDFWKDASSNIVPNSLEERLNLWKNRLPIKEDFIEYSDYSMFGPANFIVVMEGLGLFDRQSILKEFNYLPYDRKLFIKEKFDFMKNNFDTMKTISHRQYLDIIRNYL
jgi:tryptophan halogenase